MAPKKTPIKITVDATGRAAGRVAVEAAVLLQGKTAAAYAPHEDAPVFVEVRNAAKVRITGKKLEQKEFFHYSGYPGGLRRDQLKAVMAVNPAKAIAHAVRGMLPKNRLRQPRMNRLTVHND
jgi:large subunit ribosomal protein L13